MAINTNPSSRRALLAAAAGGTVALVAESLARPLAARAHDADDVRLGGENVSASTTTLRSLGGSASVLAVESNQGPAIDAASGTSPAIRAVSDTEVAISAVSKQHVGIVGYGGDPGGSDPRTNLTGVMGQSHAGPGVAGMSKSGEGVHASSETGSGVYAYCPAGFGLDAGSDSGIAVRAFSKKTGVQGITEGTFDFGANRDVVGVLGISRSVGGVGGNGIGVEGRSDTGIGVLGGGQVGVHGATGFPGGIGVEAKSETGPALHAIAVDPEGGARAIVAEGPVVFSSAGLGNLVGGKAKVTPGVALDDGSKVLITLMRNPGAQALTPYVEVTPGPAGTGFFRVHVPNARAAAVPFAYFAIS